MEAAIKKPTKSKKVTHYKLPSKHKKSRKTNPETRLDIQTVRTLLAETPDLDGRWAIQSCDDTWPTWMKKGLQTMDYDRQHMIWVMPHNAHASSTTSYSTQVTVNTENNSLDVVYDIVAPGATKDQHFEISIPWNQVLWFELRGIGHTNNPRVVQVYRCDDYDTANIIYNHVRSLMRIQYPNMDRYQWSAIRTRKQVA